MSKTISRIGVMTAGGDCPGLNAVVRAVCKTAFAYDIEVCGIADGFQGLLDGRVRPLTARDVSGILTVGGTILGSSNKANPTRMAVGKGPDGKPVFEDQTQVCLTAIRNHRLEAIVVAGGDGSMTVAGEMIDRGNKAGMELNFVGVPKTIDNDLFGTDLTFGFQTAVAIASDALDRVHTTAASHHRVMVVEVMGRNAGWIALHAGVASGADVVLIPEIPFSFDKVCEAIKARDKAGKHFSIICVAEGAKPIGGSAVVARTDLTSPDPIRLGGIGKVVADRIEDMTEVESRYVVLGHVQRGGTPVPGDRVLATQLGHQAMALILSGKKNRMVAVQGGRLTDVPITECAGRQRKVGLEDPLLKAAREIGIGFGD